MHDTDFLSADNWKWPAAFSWRLPGYEKHWGPPPPHIHQERFVDLNTSVNFSLGNDISASKWMKITLKFWQKNTSDKYGQLWIKCTLIFTPSLLLEPLQKFQLRRLLADHKPPVQVHTTTYCIRVCGCCSCSVDVRHQTKCYLLFFFNSQNFRYTDKWQIIWIWGHVLAPCGRRHSVSITCWVFTQTCS